MHCILIMGIPATGKSIIAKYLSEQLFSKGFIKELLFDTIGFKSREEKIDYSNILDNIKKLI